MSDVLPHWHSLICPRRSLHLFSGESKRLRAWWHADLTFVGRDLWVGAFWKRTGNCVDLYVCLLPCLPIHLSWWWSREGEQW